MPARLATWTALALLPATQAVAQTDLNTCFSASHPDDARLRACERVISIRGIKPADLARAYNARGSIFFRRKEYDAAIAEYTEAIRHAPQDVMAFYNRGSALTEKNVSRPAAQIDNNELDRAIADFTQSLRIDPKRVLSYGNRGTAHYLKRDMEKAKADYVAALRLDPNNAQIAESLKRIEQESAAQACTSDANSPGTENEKLQRCERTIMPGTVREPAALAQLYVHRGIIYARLKQFDRAIAELGEAINLQPDVATFCANARVRSTSCAIMTP
jgi:tetratricopeptide (TPR) repeat protein